MVPERPEVSVFLVKTNHLFLPFVSSIFMGSWEEFPFYPMPALPMWVSLFLVLFREISQKRVCTPSTGQCEHRIVCFFGQFKTCTTMTYLCKAYGFFCDSFFHKLLFILWNITVSTHFCGMQCQTQNVVECCLLKETYSSFYPISPQLCCRSLSIWLTLHKGSFIYRRHGQV